jgi:hypothetical protein
MAHRRSLAAGRVAAGLLAGLTVATLMAGAVFLSNEVTNLRAGIAVLENRRCCLEAESARLQTDWNRASAPEMVMERARVESGLAMPTTPALVLVRADIEDNEAQAKWRNLLAGLGGGSEAQATAVPARRGSNRLVSLVPRAMAGEDR